MFLFEMSLLVAYWNSSYDFGERHGPFLCYGRIIANSAVKEFNVTNINTKRAHQIVKRAYHYIAYFLNCQNNLHLCAAMTF